MTRRGVYVCAIVALWGAACGSEATDNAAAAGSGASGGAGGQPTGGAGSGGSGGSAGGGAGGSAGSGGSPVTCPETPLMVGEHQFTIQFDGNEREYEVQVPASYDNQSAVPLVLDLHGYTDNKDNHQSISGMAGKAEAEGFVVIRPNGSGAFRSWNGGDGCCGTAQSENLDDVGLMKALVAEVSGALCIDPARVYATGLSNGGALSHRLACEAADVFAAVAPISYPLDFDPFTKCTPSRPIAVMHMHGDNDFVIPFEGGFGSAPVPDSFAYWAETNGCQGDPVETFTMGSSKCDTYESCDAGVQVTLCTIAGPHVLYTNSDGVALHDLAWGFLSSYTLP